MKSDGPDRDGWVIDGAKRWLGNGSIADLVIVWATDDDEDVGGFVVEREAVDGNSVDPIARFQLVQDKLSRRLADIASVGVPGDRSRLWLRLWGALGTGHVNISVVR